MQVYKIGTGEQWQKPSSCPLRLFSDAKQGHGSVRISAARLQSPSHSLLVVERVVMVPAVAVAASESSGPLVGQFCSSGIVPGGQSRKAALALPVNVSNSWS